MKYRFSCNNIRSDLTFYLFVLIFPDLCRTVPSEKDAEADLEHLDRGQRLPFCLHTVSITAVKTENKTARPSVCRREHRPGHLSAANSTQRPMWRPGTDNAEMSAASIHRPQTEEKYPLTERCMMGNLETSEKSPSKQPKRPRCIQGKLFNHLRAYSVKKQHLNATLRDFYPAEGTDVLKKEHVSETVLWVYTQ